MNDIIQAMVNRRSIRNFKADMPKKEDLEQIIEAGLYAANGRGQQAPVIVAVTDKSVVDKLSKVNCEIGGWDEGFNPFYGAPVDLIVLVPKDIRTGIYDGSLVMGNMMLAAHSLGLGSIWVHRAKETFEMDEWKQFLKDLGLEGEYEGIANCVVGYASGDTPNAAPRKENRVFWA